MKKWMAVMLAGMMTAASLGGCGSTGSTAETEAPAEETGTAETDASDAAEEDAAAEDSAAGESDMAYVQEKGTLVVGITDFAPMDYKDENGEWIGFDADMAKAFAESLGVEAEFVEIDWDGTA